jgi:tripartite-type tricarboxylate transporter receptor subunit TctC
MQCRRRQFLQLAGAAAAAPALPSLSLALDYPSRPVRMIVPFAPGGAFDIFARLIGPGLSQRLGQPFIIENRAGAGGNIGTEVVVNAPRDGYTLLMVGAYNAINATLYSKLNFNFIRDIAAVAGIARVPLVVVVHPSVPVKTVPDFIAYAKANAGKINMGSSGNGSSPHLAGELFKMMAGVNLVHVPYRGAGPALIDLLGGQVQVMFATVPSSIEYIRAGTLRPLAVTTAMRSEVLPDLPPVGDFVAQYDASDSLGIGVPKNTPYEIVEKLNKEINVILADPKLKARFYDLGAAVLTGSPGEFATLMAEETEKWAKVVNFSGAKPD